MLSRALGDGGVILVGKGCDAGVGGTEIYYLVLAPALESLVCLDDGRLEIIPLVSNHLLRSTILKVTVLVEEYPSKSLIGVIATALRPSVQVWRSRRYILSRCSAQDLDQGRV